MKIKEKPTETGENMAPVPFPVPADERRADFDIDYVLDAVRPAGKLPELRVAAYIRVSTDLLDQENSYVAQERYFHQMITSNPQWKLVGVYSDHGLSGTGTADRVGFRRLIRHCKEGRVDRIVCKSISRFARNTADFSRTILLLRSLRITIFFEKENLDSADLQNEFILSVLGAFAQEESRSISDSVKDGIRMNMRQGNVPNVAVYGYRFTGNWLRAKNGYEYREIEVIQEEARVVQSVFEKVKEGRNFADIARTLNMQHIPAPSSSYDRARRVCSRKGQLKSELKDGWKAVQISAMVRNERYVGDVLTQKTFISDYLTHKVKVNKGEIYQYYIREHHPAIVDRRLYEEVQRVLEEKRRKQSGCVQKSESPFRRKIVCGECGRFYCSCVREGKSIWCCPTAAQKNGTHLCHAENIAEETIVFALYEAVFREYGLERTVIFKKQDAGTRERDKAEKYRRKKIQELFRDIQERLENVLNDDYVERERSLYKRQLAEIDKVLEKDAAELMRRESREYRNDYRMNEKRYEKIARKLGDLEEYWKELELDYEPRATALQWLKSLPRGKRGLRGLLQGISGEHFRAFVLDITVCSQEKFKIRWFDDRYTEVILTDGAEGDDNDG